MGKRKSISATAAGTLDVNLLGHDIEVDFEVDYRVVTAPSQGQLYGPPENCYPAEGAEIEIVDPVTFYLSPSVLTVFKGDLNAPVRLESNLGSLSDEQQAYIGDVAQAHVDEHYQNGEDTYDFRRDE